jgi:hypothetical protein
VCLHLRDSRRPPHTLTASVDPAGGATAQARHRPHHRLTAAAGPQSRWNATIAPVQLDTTRHDSARLFAKPFAATPGFNPVWWTYGDVRGPLAWCSVTDPDLGEIARAQIKLRSVVGEAYPTRPIPRGGATEIDLIEVRADLRGRGLGIGRSVLALIKEAFAGPYVALSLDEGSDGFWRRIGWAEHDHPDADEARACGAGVPAVLFETS